MNCLRCQKTIPDDAVLCCYCGRKIIKSPQAKAHQRGNGSGCAYKRGKTWTACVTMDIKYDEHNVRHQIRRTKGGFKTRNEALAYIPKLKYEQTAKKKAPTVLHYWELYRDNEYQKLSKSKKVAYKCAWKKMNAIQYRPVDSLSVQDLRSVVNDNTCTYYPARDMKVLLNHIFYLAAADRWVQKDLPDFIILPELEEKERIPFNEDEQKALWRLYEEGDRRAAIPLIMIYTGMMPGEMQDLKTDMIDYDAQRIVGVGLKTKVRKKSPVYLPDTIIPVLIDEVAQAKSKLGYVWKRNKDEFYDNYYAVLEAAGCRKLEPYSCRHTTATALTISEGIAPQTVKKIMRWSTTRMLDKYAHPDDKDALEALNKLK